jgi:5-hydroxyisourate hydrolase
MNAGPTGRLTTHVLDTSLGQPARGIEYRLYGITGDARTLLCEGRTNDDGRANAPLLAGDALAPGVYELVFAAGEYQERNPGGAGGFYDLIPIRFQVTDASGHYHVPLLLSPFGYSTYRGS